MYLGSTEEEAKRALDEQSSTADALQQLAIRLSTAVAVEDLGGTAEVRRVDQRICKEDREAQDLDGVAARTRCLAGALENRDRRLELSHHRVRPAERFEDFGARGEDIVHLTQIDPHHGFIIHT